MGLDFESLPLELGEKAAEHNGTAVEWRRFDVTSPEKLPKANILLSADMMYTEELALALANRVSDVIQEGLFEHFIISDSNGVVTGDEEQELTRRVIFAQRLAKNTTSFNVPKRNDNLWKSEVIIFHIARKLIPAALRKSKLASRGAFSLDVLAVDTNGAPTSARALF